MDISHQTIDSFRNEVYTYYENNKRSFPWREDLSEYSIFISEVMLQQTQAGPRTVKKYIEFMKRFPDFQALAPASLQDILQVWQGLGYNRRALYLKKAAESIVRDYNGCLPRTIEKLDSLPGIGSATASSIMAFAFNVPVLFIETNIRTVFIHHFFSNSDSVTDEDILELVNHTLDHSRPREWYYALMDYGSMLKKLYKNPSRKSANYTKQSTFEGSTRQLRGAVLRELTSRRMSLNELTVLTKSTLSNYVQSFTLWQRKDLLNKIFLIGVLIANGLRKKKSKNKRSCF